MYTPHATQIGEKPGVVALKFTRPRRRPYWSHYVSVFRSGRAHCTCPTFDLCGRCRHTNAVLSGQVSLRGKAKVWMARIIALYRKHRAEEFGSIMAEALQWLRRHRSITADVLHHLCPDIRYHDTRIFGAVLTVLSDDETIRPVNIQRSIRAVCHHRPIMRFERGRFWRRG